MPAFQLRFEDASKTFAKALHNLSEKDTLMETWAICRKVALHLEQGERLENLAKRLAHLHISRPKTASPQKAEEERSAEIAFNGQWNSSQLASVEGESLERLEQWDRTKSSSGLFERRQKAATICNKTSTISLKKRPSIRSRRMFLESQFKGFDPISFLCISNSRPVFKLPVPSPKETNIESSLPSPALSFTTLDTTIMTNYDNLDDPSELCIIPNPPIVPGGPFHLQSIEEEDDDELETPTSATNVDNRVYFVNPFATPTPDQQLPSPPQTPAQSETLPPHVNAEEEEEFALSSSDPMDLTGRVKKMMDPPIALGGTSDIFYGEWQIHAPKKVAIKVLRTTNMNSVETVKRRLRREMDIWWKCRHRNIVPLFGFASDFSNLDALVSPWMKNGSAPAYIKANRCNWNDRLKLFGDVVAGLKYLHHFSPPIIHGDLKPANVLISDTGDACLCDFGLARVIYTGSGSSGFTTTNFAGSIRYMAPELLDSEEDEEDLPNLSVETDIYALGCVGVEMVTDQMPYANRMLDAQVMHDIIQGLPPVRVPPLGTLISKPSLKRFWDLVAVMWQRDTKRRPNIVEVGRMLTECRSTTGPPLTALSVTGSPSGMLNRIHTGSSTTKAGPSSGTIISNVQHVSGAPNNVQMTTSSHISASSSSVYRRSTSRPTSREPISRRTRTSSASPSPPVSLLSPGRLYRSTSMTNKLSRSSQGELSPDLSALPRHLASASPAGDVSAATTTADKPKPVTSRGNEGTSTPTSSNSSSGSSLSNPLHQLKRSSSLIMKGAFGVPLRRASSLSTRSNFQPSINASEQVWHDA
ncbi:kinase-like protein [Serendipita vermifera]|nr:kinase-like protein [Serendipita vermifera]